METHIIDQYSKNLERIKEIKGKIAEIKKAAKIELDNKLDYLNKEVNIVQTNIDSSKKEIRTLICAAENETLIVPMNDKMFILTFNKCNDAIEMIPVSTIDNVSQRLMMKKLGRK